MFKIIILPIFLSINIFALDYTFHCKGDVTSPTLVEWSSTSGNPSAVFGFENNPDALPKLYGEIDNANMCFTYWDDTSPVCGGDGTDNIQIEGVCDSNLGDGCWDVLLGVGDNPIIEATDTGYTNSVIFVNKKPCLPRNVSNFSFGAYEWDNNTDLGLANANLNTIFNEYIYPSTESEATEQRAVCFAPDPNAPIDYTPILNNIVTNTSTIEAINQRGLDLDNNLNTFTNDKSIDNITDTSNDITDITTTYETTLTNSFDTYSDVFGFGGYGVAPDPITFIMFDKSYTVFDISTIGATNIDLIRNTFLLFAYLFGFILVFKGN